MIKKLSDKDKGEIMRLLTQDSIVNYFIIMGLEREKYKEVFREKWGQFNKQGELISVLFKRKSGTFQFYSSQEYDVEEICSIIKKQDFNRLIGEEAIIKKLINNYNFSGMEKGAYISKLENLKSYSINKISNVKSVTLQDIDSIIDLYESVFTGFAPRELIVKKYENSTGRGYCIKENGNIISIAQSSYEFENTAIIVGVATHLDYRRKGLATLCLVKLCEELLKEGKILYLQYDNPKAGEIYKELGFKDIGRMINCFNYNESTLEQKYGGI